MLKLSILTIKYLMAYFEVSKKIEGKEPLYPSDIYSFIKNRLNIHCVYSDISQDDNDPLTIKGRVKENVLTPVVKFESTFLVKIDGCKARITVSGNSNVNWIFWVLIIIGLFTGIVLLVGIGLYLLQRTKPKELVEDILNSVDVEFGAI